MFIQRYDRYDLTLRANHCVHAFAISQFRDCKIDTFDFARVCSHADLNGLTPLSFLLHNLRSRLVRAAAHPVTKSVGWLRLTNDGHKVSLNSGTVKVAFRF